MKDSITITKERSIANENVSLELNKVGVHTATLTSAIFGCWAVLCLASGMINSGGPANLVSNFVSAFTG